MNPYPSSKDSRVEWIGEIPSGWEASKLKYHGKFFSGFSFNSVEFTDEG